MFRCQYYTEVLSIRSATTMSCQRVRETRTKHVRIIIILHYMYLLFTMVFICVFSTLVVIRTAAMFAYLLCYMYIFIFLRENFRSRFHQKNDVITRLIDDLLSRILTNCHFRNKLFSSPVNVNMRMKKNLTMSCKKKKKK